MKASELRIGNYVNSSSENCLWFKGNFILDGYKMAKTIRYGCQGLNPIPLTEEWLLKFGFENIDDGTYYEIECNRIVLKEVADTIITLSLEFDNEDCYFQIGSGYNWTDALPIKHVHQLQNLYFALTGEELELHEKTT